MATTSYSNLFGTNGAGSQGSKAGISTLFGQQETARADDDEMERQRKQAAGQPTQTFAQMQSAGQARPAPPTQMQTVPQASPMMSQLQSQLSQAAPSAMVPAQQPSLQQQAFQQMRQSSQADLQAQFQAQQQQLNEEMARRGLSSSSIGAGRMGDLAGQQARALSNLDAQLLQQQAMQDFEAQQAREARQFTGQESALERALRTQLQQAGFGQESELARLQREFLGGESQAERDMRERLMREGQSFEAAQAEAQRAFAGTESALERALRERLQMQQLGESAADRALRERFGLAELTGTLGGQETIASRQFNFQQQMANQQLAMDLARIFAGSDNPQESAALQPILQQLLARLPGYQAPAASPSGQLPAGSTTPTYTPPPAGTSAAYNPLADIPYGGSL